MVPGGIHQFYAVSWKDKNHSFTTLRTTAAPPLRLTASLTAYRITLTSHFYYS